MRAFFNFLVLAQVFIILPGCSKDSDDTQNNNTDTSVDSGSTTDSGANTDTQSSTTPSTEFPDPTFGLSTQTIVHDQVEREYLLYVPESYDASSQAPVMMNFHGFGGYAVGHMEAADMREVAEEDGFILIYPQGTRLDGEPHWNTYLPGGDNKSSADDYGFVGAMLDDLSLNYAIDSSRVYAAGYSNGGDFTYTLACFLSDKITAIASVSGLMWEGTVRDCEVTHPTTVLTIHGTGDRTRPYDGWEEYMLSIEQSISFWNDQNNITEAPTVTNIQDGGTNILRYDYFGGDGGSIQRHYKVIGGGHIWFSFSEGGVEVNRLIWEMLSSFDSDGAI